MSLQWSNGKRNIYAARLQRLSSPAQTLDLASVLLAIERR